MIEITPPSKLARNIPIRKILGCVSSEPVKLGNYIIKVRDCPLEYHDLYHLEVACLERILIGEHKVSGIHGLNLPMFHDSPIVVEYGGLLDEVRVAFHEWLTRPSIFNTIKAISWMVWLVSQGINPIAVLIRHIKVLKAREHFLLLAQNMTFIHLKDSGINLVAN